MGVKVALLVLLLGTSLCWSGAARADSNPTGSDATTAAELYDRGLRSFRERDFRAAAADFEAAFRTEPQPSVLFNLGLAYAASERPVEAVRVLEQYLETTNGSLSASRQRLVHDVLKAQEQRIGTLTISAAPEGTTVSIDGRELEPAALSGPIRLSSGVHTLVAARDGYSSTTRSVRVGAKANTALDLELQPATRTVAPSPVLRSTPPYPAPRRASEPASAPGPRAPAPRTKAVPSAAHAAAFRAVGIGSAVGAIAFATLGGLFAVQAQSAEARVNEAALSGKHWNADYEASEASGRRAQYAAWGSFAAAGVCAGVASWLLIWPPSSTRSDNHLALEASPQGVSVQGRVHF